MAAGSGLLAGCLSSGDGASGGGDGPSIIVFNTGDGTVSVIDPDAEAVVDTRDVGLSSSFPSNQYTPDLVDDPDDRLWVNVGRGVRALDAGSLSVVASVETGSGANWQELTPDGSAVVVSAREPAHRQLLIDADTSSDAFGTVAGEIDRSSGADGGAGPCDVTIHPEGRYAYVPDLFADTLTVLDLDGFEIATTIDVAPVGSAPSSPWMGTVAPDGRRMLVEHAEGDNGTESVWDLSDPAAPTEVTRLTAADDLGARPLTSEIGPDSETGYVFTPGSQDVSVIDLTSGAVTDRIDLGGAAFVGTWDPDRTKLYVPVQTNDEVAVIDHEAGRIEARIDVGPAPYGATAARVRPTEASNAGRVRPTAAANADLEPASSSGDDEFDTTYCIGNCACGHTL